MSQYAGAVFGDAESHVTITSSKMSGNAAELVSGCTNRGDAFIISCVHGMPERDGTGATHSVCHRGGGLCLETQRAMSPSCGAK